MALVMLTSTAAAAKAAPAQPASVICFDGTPTPPDTVLAPGGQLVWPLEVQEDGNPAPLTDQRLQGGSLTLKVTEGKALLGKAAIEKRGGAYALVLTAAAGSGLPLGRVSLAVTLAAGGRTLAAGQACLQVGWPAADTAELEQLRAGEEIPVSQQAPAFTAGQLALLMSKNAGNPLTFAGGNWKFTVAPAAARTVSFAWNNTPVQAVTAQLQQQGRRFSFLNFAGGASLGAQGTVTLDVSDQRDDFGGRFYVYRYVYGRLYRYPAAYSAAGGTLTFRASTLDRFVVTNLPVKEGTVVTGENTGGAAEKNPDTGAPARLPGALLLACLAGAAAWGLRRRG